MKTNLRIALELVEKGLTPKTLSKLTEGQIKVLHSKLVLNEKKETKEEIKQTVTKVTYDPTNADDQKKLAQLGLHVDPATKKISMSQSGGQITTEEMFEQPDTEVSNIDKSAGGTTQDPTQVMAPDGMDDLSDKTIDKEKDITEVKKDDSNPFAICTAQLGKEFGTTKRHLWSPKQKNKYERCVVDVKKSLKEGKNPVSLFLENQIMKIVERNLPPRITKGDLVKYLSENGPATAPSKPATKPTTKPGKPDTRPRPKHPGKNPNPGENPAPKAKRVSPEVAKDEVMDLIMKLLEK